MPPGTIIHSFLPKSSVTPLQTPRKLPHSYITDKETGFLHRLSEGTHSSPVRGPSVELQPDPSQTLQEHPPPPINLLFHTERYHARWAVERVSPYSLPPLRSARHTRRGAGHTSSLLLPHEPKPVPDPPGADSAPVSRERLAPPGMQGALGKRVGAPRCPAPRLRPESNPTLHAPIRGAPRPPHLCARPRSQLRSRRGPPCPP